jgi:hypothetical protein
MVITLRVHALLMHSDVQISASIYAIVADGFASRRELRPYRLSTLLSPVDFTERIGPGRVYLIQL